MQGGKDERLLQRAHAQLQLNQELREAGKVEELQLALSVFTEAVLGKGKANQIFRWSMLDIFVESPLYQEIVQQGLQQGLQQGRREELQRMLSKLLAKRFGSVDAETIAQVQNLPVEQAESLVEAIFDFDDQRDLKTWLSQVEPKTSNLPS